MSLDACADLVQRGDPDRFRAAMIAPMPVRGDLIALYAFNLEVSRAPWVTQEPMIAEMRVQWWADVIDEIYDRRPVRAHEVAVPLAHAAEVHDLPRARFEALIEARRLDALRVDPEDWSSLESYIDRTGGGLMGLAAQVLGAEGNGLKVAQDFGWASGAANYLGALPELLARGRQPLPEDHSETAERLRHAGQERLKAARARRADVPRRARPAFLAGWQADHKLGQAGLDLPPTEAPRATFLWRSLTGRW